MDLQAAPPAGLIAPPIPPAVAHHRLTVVHLHHPCSPAMTVKC